MKLLVAVINPDKMETVWRALEPCEISGMTVSEVRGCGRQRGYTEVYRGAEVKVRLLAKLKLEILVDDRMVNRCVEAIVHAVRSDGVAPIGAGKIFVLPVDDGIRIRTGERGLAAIGP